MTAKIGYWYTETDKNIMLYCAAIDSIGQPQLSYGPNSPIAVTPTIDDFLIFFKPILSKFKR